MQALCSGVSVCRMGPDCLVNGGLSLKVKLVFLMSMYASALNSDHELWAVTHTDARGVNLQWPPSLVLLQF